MGDMVKVYRSKARPGLADSDIQAILDSSRRNNPNTGLSGMLLYGRGRFIQLLEGPGPAVDRIYRRILSDPRHNDVVLVYDRSGEPRRFTDWAMGFAPIEPYTHLASVAHFMQLDEAMDTVGFSPDAALRLLLDFRREFSHATAAVAAG
jgi:hypothetical protein